MTKLPTLLGTVAAFALAAAASTSAQATVTTITLLPSAGSNVVGVGGDSAPGFGTGAWAAPGNNSKSELYISAASLFSAPVRIDDIASISYWTKKATTGAAVDWTFYIYTALQASGNSGGWYHTRLNSEPYFTQSTVASNTWHQWSTSGPNAMRFYDQPRGGSYGTYVDPTLAALQAGPVATGDVSHTIDYGQEYINLFSLQTGSAWANGFTGLVDGLTITLNNGDVGSVNLESTAPVPEPASLALVGLALAALGAFTRKRLS